MVCATTGKSSPSSLLGLHPFLIKVEYKSWLLGGITLKNIKFFSKTIFILEISEILNFHSQNKIKFHSQILQWRNLYFILISWSRLMFQKDNYSLWFSLCPPHMHIPPTCTYILFVLIWKAWIICLVFFLRVYQLLRSYVRTQFFLELQHFRIVI